MTLTPRPYRDENDFERMKAILVAGRRAANGSYYVHMGDLSWWLFGTPRPEGSLGQAALVWEDNGEVIGWSLFSPEVDWAFDVFVHPRERGSRRSELMFNWTEERMCALAKGRGGKSIRHMWVFEDDATLISMLERRGFVRSDEHMLYMTRTLARPIPGFSLPEGYVVRPVAGEHEAGQRAAVTHSAFRSEKAFERYLTAYRQFMRAPVYPAGMDLVVFTPEGRGAACCIGWLDAVNQVGLFEPVATHPDFHRRGLGKAVVLEGLRRMKAQGMASAIVCADHDNLAAQRLYASAGFRVANSLRTFVKEI